MKARHIKSGKEGEVIGEDASFYGVPYQPQPTPLYDSIVLHDATEKAESEFQPVTEVDLMALDTGVDFDQAEHLAVTLWPTVTENLSAARTVEKLINPVRYTADLPRFHMAPESLSYRCAFCSELCWKQWETQPWACSIPAPGVCTHILPPSEGFP